MSVAAYVPKPVLVVHRTVHWEQSGQPVAVVRVAFLVKTSIIFCHIYEPTFEIKSWSLMETHGVLLPDG